MSQQSGWQLSGHAPDAYERYIVPAFMAAKARELVEMAPVGSGARVLDVACGTGVCTREAARAVGTTGKVVGADLNETMLDMARAVAQRHAGLPVEWHHADAMALPFPAATFDVGLCQYGLEFFPDRSQGLREIARVLVPGGRLALRVWRALGPPAVLRGGHPSARPASPCWCSRTYRDGLHLGGSRRGA